MPNFFFTDASGQKQGPVNDQQLLALSAQGIIAPTTVLETDSGHRGQAAQIPGLFPAPAPASPFIAATPQAVPVPNNAAVQYAPANPSTSPLPMILLVGLAVVGTICLGVGLYALHWSRTHYSTHYTPFEKDSRGSYVLTLSNGKKAAMSKEGTNVVNGPSNGAFKAGMLFLVVAIGIYAGGYVVFIRTAKRKQE